jgi:hypothetical protein
MKRCVGKSPADEVRGEGPAAICQKNAGGGSSAGPALSAVQPLISAHLRPTRRRRDKYLAMTQNIFRRELQWLGDAWPMLGRSEVKALALCNNIAAAEKE